MWARLEPIPTHMTWLLRCIYISISQRKAGSMHLKTKRRLIYQRNVRNQATNVLEKPDLRSVAHRISSHCSHDTASGPTYRSHTYIRQCTYKRLLQMRPPIKTSLPSSFRPVTRRTTNRSHVACRIVSLDFTPIHSQLHHTMSLPTKPILYHVVGSPPVHTVRMVAAAIDLELDLQ